MHYRITLPTDYDMGIIRTRVETKGSTFDTFAGLGIKAYLIREAGVDGSPINEYAPFYLWNDVDGMKQFLYGGIGFGGIVSSFGRPPVAHYNGLGAQAGLAAAEAPLWARLETHHVPDHCDPAAFIAEVMQEVIPSSQLPGVHTASVVIDPTSWTLLTFTLLTQLPEPAARTANQEVFQVLHLSQPGYHQLTA
jgi:Domain of unknown function (DUF4865)